MARGCQGCRDFFFIAPFHYTPGNSVKGGVTEEKARQRKAMAMVTRVNIIQDMEGRHSRE